MLIVIFSGQDSHASSGWGYAPAGAKLEGVIETRN